MVRLAWRAGFEPAGQGAPVLGRSNAAGIPNPKCASEHADNPGNFQTPTPAEHVRQCLELRSAAKPELLNPVEILLQERDRIVEAQRSERRIPDQTDADGRPRRRGI